MISEQLIEKAKEISNKDISGLKALGFLTDVALMQGQRLANFVGADKNIVLLGTLLMDCMLSQAKNEGRIAEHTVMGEEKTTELLSMYPEVTDKERDNVLHCVKEHHGVEQFYSLESEVVCNADCYKFLTVNGVVGSISYRGEDETLDDIVDLHLEKAKEKWNALSLDICKKELEPQYKAIKIFLENYKNE